MKYFKSIACIFMLFKYLAIQKLKLRNGVHPYLNLVVVVRFASVSNDSLSRPLVQNSSEKKKRGTFEAALMRFSTR